MDLRFDLELKEIPNFTLTYTVYDIHTYPKYGTQFKIFEHIKNGAFQGKNK